MPVIHLTENYLRPVISLVTIISLSTASPSDDLVRTTTAGLVRGVPSGPSDAWLGVPYAAPPVGPLRWQAPQPVAPWTEIRAADRFGSACAQLGGLQGPGKDGEPFGPGIAASFGAAVGSEDCLTLNLWRPRAEPGPLPVVVFIHGGANVAGYTADPLYEGARLASRFGALVVTVNYRLGVFGWFGAPAGVGGTDSLALSGNFGLLDLVAALGFVRANAAAFGGDAGNLTIMGQSAGAVNAFALMVSPLGQGLFQRVVALSGALVAVPAEAQRSYSLKVAAALVRRDGLAADPTAAERYLERQGDRWVGEYLRSKATGELLAAAATVPGGGLPTADGVVLPTDPAAAVAAGRVARLPVLLGSTAEEGKFFLTDVYRVSDGDRWRMLLGAGGRPPLSAILKDGMTAAGFEAKAAQAGQPVMRLIADTRQRFAAHMPVYAMEFAWAEQDEPWRTLLGATHGMDLPFVFEQFGPSLYGASFTERNRVSRDRLVEVMGRALWSFIRNGVPSLDSLPWRPWSTSGDVARLGRD